MKIYNCISTMLVLIFLLVSCKTSQYTIEDYDVAAIKFGNAGGFAGTNTEYILLENGQLFHKKPRTNAFVELERLEMSFVKQCFDNYDLIDEEAKKINAPGNMTYWLAYENGEDKTISKWGGHEQVPNHLLKLLYTNLIRIKKSDNLSLDR